jgi:hypothetical protein
MTRRLVTPLLVSGKCVVRRPGQRPAFVKFFVSKSPGTRQRHRAGFDHERLCLRALQGLAVPRVVRLTRDERALLRLPDGVPALVLAMEYLPGVPLGHGGHSFVQHLGGWLFVTEQLAAFREHGVLYADVKCNNIIASERPFRVHIVDFDAATAVVPGEPLVRLRRYTLGMEAPEASRSRLVTEAAVVYELGVLLFHILTDLDNRALRSQTDALARAQRLLVDAGAAGLADLLAACVQDEPAQRPQHYGEVLGRARATALPPEVRAVWSQLRGPTREHLAALGFEDP